MTSYKSEGVIADLKREINDVDRCVKGLLRKSKDTFTPEFFSGKMLDVSREYLHKMHRIFLRLKTDIYLFLSKFNYKFSIDFDFLFHMAFGVYRLVCYDNKYDLFMTLVYVVRTFLGNKLDQYMDVVCNWCDKFIMELKSYGKVKSEALPEFTPEFSLLKWFDTILDSNIVRSIRELILNLVGLKFFDRNMSSKFVATLGAARPVSMVDFSRNIIELIEEFIQFGVNFRNSGSFIQALSKGDPAIAFLEKTYVLTLQAKNVYIGDDANFRTLGKMRGEEEASNEANSVCIAAKDFVMKLRAAVIEGNSIASRKKVPAAFKARMYALTELLQDLMNKMRSKNRRAPFGLILHGDPSIGKSSILVHIYKVWSRYKNLEYSRDLVYDRNPKSSYWTNHDPISQPIIHYPELGSTASAIVKTKGDETIDEMLMVADTQPYSAEMAAAEEKGKCMVMPELLVVDCNDPKMNLEYTNNNPAAIRRRFVYIEAKVKPEYANLTALDESKIPEDLENKMDLWTFQVYKQIPRGIKDSVKTPIGEPNVDIFGLTSILLDLFEEHDHKQDGFGQAVKEDIDKYIIGARSSVVSEAHPIFDCVTPYFITMGIMLMALNAPWYLPAYMCCMIAGTTLYEYCIQALSFPLFIKIKVCNAIARWCIRYRVDCVFYDYVDTIKVTGNYFYLFAKTCFVEDLSYYEYKMRFSSKGFMLKYSTALMMFSVTLSFLRIVCSFLEIAHSFTSEGNIIESSGEFNESNIDAEIKKREEMSEASFPEAKKKLNSDMDYDIVENIYPRYVSEERNKKDPEQVYNSIKRNERFLKITYDGKTFSCRGVGIKGDYMLLNRHSIPGDATQIVSSCKFDYESNIKRAIVDLSDLYAVGDDVVMMRFPGELFKDITFALTNILPMKVSLEGRFADAKRRVIMRETPITVKNYYRDYVLENTFQYEFAEHANGDCGRPLMIVVNKQCFFVGIHSAGADQSADSFASIFNKQNIEGALESFSREFVSKVNSEGTLRLPKGTTIKLVTDRSPILFENTPGLGVIGSISNYSMISPKTRLLKSPLVDEIENLVGESAYREDGKMKYLPPMMRSKMVNGKYIAPYNIWIKKVGVAKKELPSHIMKATSMTLTVYLLSQLKAVGVKNLKPFTLAVAQNGYPENFYIRAIRNGTSGGFLLPGKKSKYNTKVELDFKKDAVMPDFEVKEQVLEILRAYEHGELSHDIVGAQLKDEPRTFDKAVSGKTRIFAMSSYPMTLVNRQYLMPFYALMVEHRDIFGTKVGINMHSEEAGEMYDSLVNFSPLIMEGDYGGYDTSMPIGVGLMANTVVENCLKHLGYNDYSLNIVRGIMSDNLFPTLSMEGNLIVAAGFQPSGKYATAEDNSLRGLILLSFAYMTMCTPIGEGHSHNLTTEYGVSDFFKYLKPVTYGDDMLCSVKSELSEFFNNITYSKFVEEVYGMEFTTADKTAHSSRFIEPEKMSFLKRSFRFNEMLDRKVALLDIDSLVKSLSYILPSKEVGLDVQIIETCQSVLREYFFYCNSVDEYEAKRTQFINVLLNYVEFTRVDLEKLFPRGANLKFQYEKRVV